MVISIILLHGATAISMEKDSILNSTSFERIVLDKPIIDNLYDNYFNIKYDKATSYVLETGEPLIPKVTKIFCLPFGTNINNVEVEYKYIDYIKINGLIEPAPEPIIDGTLQNSPKVINNDVYKSDLWYPYSDFNYYQKVGLNGEEHVVFLTVQCYPIKYNPIKGLISYAKEIQISISYKEPYPFIIFPEEYDLLIVTPSDFSSLLTPLVEHKNKVGIDTYLLSLEDIYSTYSEGRDQPEKIKLAIKDSIEKYGISYVLLVGGLKGQTKSWYLPVRYGISNVERYVSDLYYADIYKIEDDEIVFEDWDSNSDGEFASWSFSKRDILDGSPDVYVGRLACRSNYQVKTMVEKIINYERQLAQESWFRNMLLIGGDTYPDSPDGVPEAEIDTNLSASYMNGFTFERLWATLGTLTGQEDVEEAINNGAGFIHMAGHANPASLVTHPPRDPKGKIIILSMYNFDNPSHINPKLNNDDMLPVIVVGGCHNSQFNVGFINMFYDILEYGIMGYFFERPHRFYYMEWVPKCWSWWLTSKPDGGAIATLGNTGLGMGIHDYGYITGLDGWLFPRFFYHYGQMNRLNIGMAQGSAITDYVHEFDINKDGEDRQMVQQWALLGDPSLLPGGYE
jgi:hypothetical protein